jgi:hypothetical protein
MSLEEKVKFGTTVQPIPFKAQWSLYVPAALT